MMELPEALNLAQQLNETVRGKRVAGLTAAQTPHKLAWYYGDPKKYTDLLAGKTIGKADAYGGLIEIKAGQADILYGEGVNLRFIGPGEARPPKHQLLIEFEDRSALCACVRMYGGMGCFRDGELDNEYYRVAKEKPSPLSPAFDGAYFDRLISAPEVGKLSLKAFLATEQRIPGLGNGVLQDILFNARMRPKRKVLTLSEKDQKALFKALRSTLSAMAARGGRDTETNLFGRPGGYRTLLSKNTADKPCPVCGGPIRKEAYLGGSVYYCGNCQKL